MSQEQAQVVYEEGWEVYLYEDTEGIVFVTFYTGADEVSRELFPHSTRVVIGIKSPTEDGIPTPEEGATLDAMEDNLLELLQKSDEVPCVFLARVTHGGQRELIFQVKEQELFATQVAIWRSANAHYQIDTKESEGWEFFEEQVWPSEEEWLMIHSRQVISTLIEHGADPQNEHELDFVFYGGVAGLAKVREQLTKRGYQESESEKAPDKLVMQKSLPLELSVLFEELRESRHLADEVGVRLDGWGAAVSDEAALTLEELEA
ncbi:MAG: DUF695 domain-containing protein [Myxococcales bacterium]|nr:DUF695 domain-containing protein [Myxococcales bacterium]